MGWGGKHLRTEKASLCRVQVETVVLGQLVELGAGEAVHLWEVQVSHSLLAFLIDYFIQLRAKYKSMKVQSFNKITLLDFIPWVTSVEFM